MQYHMRFHERDISTGMLTSPLPSATAFEPRLDSLTVNPDRSSTGPDSPDSPDRCQECQPDSPDSARHHFLAKPDSDHARPVSSSVKLSRIPTARQPDSPTVPDRTRQNPTVPGRSTVLHSPSHFTVTCPQSTVHGCSPTVHSHSPPQPPAPQSTSRSTVARTTVPP